MSFVKRENLDTKNRHVQREDNVKTKAEDSHVTGVAHLHTREYQSAGKCRKLEEAKRVSLEPSEREWTFRMHLDFGFLSCRIVRQ